MWPVVVRYPEGPVEAVEETDAVDAARRARTLMVRGPLYGVVVQRSGDAPQWRVVKSVTSACPHDARDRLNSLL